MSSRVQQYLLKYAETEAQQILPLIQTRQFKSVLVVPCFNETLQSLERLLQPLNIEDSWLVVLVVNAPNNATSQQLASNHKLLNQLNVDHKTCLSSLILFNQHWLYIVNRSTAPNLIPAKSGVGLARKIGADIACRLIHQGIVRFPWIFSTDMDAVLPADYLEQVIEHPCAPNNCSAFIYNYQHLADAHDLTVSQQLYDIRLRYYVLALRWAGSHYAFHTTGSLLAIHSEAYTKVRGFPCRNAGEDFYCLNKLAKVGKIISLRGQPITIDARLSDRVPFGTGPALHSISTLSEPKKDYLYYNPECFDALKKLLSIFKTKKNLTKDYFEKQLEQLPQEVTNALTTLKINQFKKHITQQKLEGDKLKEHFHHWFDGFKTLKLIHYLRDNHFPSLTLNKLQQHRLFQQLTNITANTVLLPAELEKKLASKELQE
ncbi:hypothetical protein [Zooshikella ganghwensis]|uniref:Glycosyltransferase family 2 protein n=1 Tax=Zooshikella ganghwensis TaxID=202772 RepID=A0A4P9VRQ7_9GAMM|nr:hypothetical protein [Zooshikella ganghwensis]RDH45479.1 hypothetical protein B9G39_19640 [Zooshikella ganghwensis]